MYDFDTIISLVTKTKELLETHQKYETYQKGEFNYVTQMDYVIQDYLISELLKLYPEYEFMSEEQAASGLSGDIPTWILDPIDGTTNFIHGFQHSAVSLALYDDSKIEVGIIYNPFRDEMFTAQRDKGAYLNNVSIRTSDVSHINNSLITIGTSPYKKNDASINFELFKRVFMDCQDIRRTGSAALDIAYVACGRTEAFFEKNLKPWDYAAGMLILKESGGTISNWNGLSLDFYGSSDVVATNTCLHPYFLDLLKEG